MRWDDHKYNEFYINWERTHAIHILSQRSAFMFSKEYFDFLLPLFFTICEIDLNTGSRVQNKQVVLMTLLCFYLVSDTSLSKQNSTSIEQLRIFLNSLVDLKLISKDISSKTCVMLSTFLPDQDDVITTDLISKLDVDLVKDLLTSSNPILLNRNHAMFYFDEPHKTTFLVKKPYPKPVDFFDEMFRVSQTIADSFLRTLYSERLHRLMEAQYKKSIFPF